MLILVLEECLREIVARKVSRGAGLLLCKPCCLFLLLFSLGLRDLRKGLDHV